MSNIWRRRNSIPTADEADATFQHCTFDLPAPFVLLHYWRFHLPAKTSTVPLKVIFDSNLRIVCPGETEVEFSTRLIGAFIAEPVMVAVRVIPPPAT
ncbi:hypothetical protein YC2023_061368 [Brassica napus]